MENPLVGKSSSPNIQAKCTKGLVGRQDEPCKAVYLTEHARLRPNVLKSVFHSVPSFLLLVVFCLVRLFDYHNDHWMSPPKVAS